MLILVSLRKRRLEQHTQRHLHLTRAANRFVRDAKTAEYGTRVEALIGCDVATGGLHRRAFYGEAIVKQILADVVDGYVEASRVGEVENIQRVLQVKIAR